MSGDRLDDCEEHQTVTEEVGRRRREYWDAQDALRKAEERLRRAERAVLAFYLIEPHANEETEAA